MEEEYTTAGANNKLRQEKMAYIQLILKSSLGIDATQEKKPLTKRLKNLHLV